MGTRFNIKPTPAGWASPLKSWTTVLAMQGLREESITTRRRHVAYLARSIQADTPYDVSKADLEQWCAAQTWSPETRHGYYNSFRGFFHHTCGSANPAANLPMIRRPRAVPRPIPDQLWRHAIATADPRTRLILNLAGAMGLRRTEISTVHRDDLIDNGTGPALIVHGKGGKQRIVPIPDTILDDLREACTGGWAFPGGHDGHLGSQHIADLANHVLPDGWTLHTCRHRFATVVYAATHDILAVQQLLGHQSVDTTQRYTAIPGDALRAAVYHAA